jgi:uncharacterized coiled-coil protein SlyX
MIPRDDLTQQELLRIIARNQYALRILTDRMASLSLENAELMAIVDELQRDLAEARQVLADLQASSGIGPLDVDSNSDGTVVHSVPEPRLPGQ